MSDFTSQANLDWVQSAVDFGTDATIANAWAELKADAKQSVAMKEDALERIQALEAELRESRENMSAILRSSTPKTELAVAVGENARLTANLKIATDALARISRGDSDNAFVAIAQEAIAEIDKP